MPQSQRDQCGSGAFPFLTYDRQKQQDTADDYGDYDRCLASPKVQHSNRLVEFSNLDLEKSREEKSQ